MGQEDVIAFFHVACRPWWSDPRYDLVTASAMLGDDEFVRGNTLCDVRNMLTYCARMAQFCDGHWGHVLETGKAAALLPWLTVLRATPSEGHASMGEEN